MTTDRRGFTIVELLVVAVLGSLLLLATYQILITNQRTYTVQAQQVQNQQTLRAALNLLVAELREVSPAGGDLGGGFNSSDFRFVQMGRFGLVCATNLAGAPPTLTVRQQEAWFEAGDNVLAFAENDTDLTTDDEWVKLTISAIDTTSACADGSAAQIMTFSSSTDQAALVADTVRTGAPVRSYVSQRYRIHNSNLARGEASPDPLVGPVRMRLEYFDADGDPTATANEVKSIRVTVVATSDAQTFGGTQVSDSLSTIVYPRN